MFGADIVEGGGLHRGPPNNPRSFANKRWARRPGCAATGLTRQRGKELSDDDARRAIQQAAADARDLAADRGLVDVADRGAAVVGWNQRDAAFAAAKSERAFGRPAERHRMRRIEIGQFHLGAIASFDRADADRHIGAEMRIGDFLDAVAAGDHGLQRRGIEQHRPDALGWRADSALRLRRAGAGRRPVS